MNPPGFAVGEVLDPVDAYDRVAPRYACLAKQRAAYLDAIDRLVTAEIPPGSRSLLDVGAGDGARAGRIAAAGGLRDLVLLAPSGVMRSHCPAQANIWAIRAEDLHHQQSNPSRRGRSVPPIRPCRGRACACGCACPPGGPEGLRRRRRAA